MYTISDSYTGFDKQPVATPFQEIVVKLYYDLSSCANDDGRIVATDIISFYNFLKDETVGILMQQPITLGQLYKPFEFLKVINGLSSVLIEYRIKQGKDNGKNA